MQYRPVKSIEIYESEVHFIHQTGVHNHLSEVKVQQAPNEQGIRYLPEQKKLIIEKAQCLQLIIPSHSHLDVIADERSQLKGSFYFGSLKLKGEAELECQQLTIQIFLPSLLTHFIYLSLLMIFLSPTLGALHALGFNSLHYVDWLGLISASLYMALRGLDSSARWVSIVVALFCVFAPEIYHSITRAELFYLLRQQEWVENILQLLLYIGLWRVGKYLKDHWFKSAM